MGYIVGSMEGLYFGKKGEQVNAHATNLCCASLTGGGFRILHDQVKTLIITFLRLAGVEANEETALWMLGKVRDPFMTSTRFCGHRQQTRNTQREPLWRTLWLGTSRPQSRAQTTADLVANLTP